MLENINSQEKVYYCILKVPFLTCYFSKQISMYVICIAVLNFTFYVSEEKGFLLKICMHCELRHKNEILICSAIMYNIVLCYTNTNLEEFLYTNNGLNPIKFLKLS